MRTFFIADTHFGHSNSLGFDHRPWNTIEEMDEEMIRRWNRKVTKQDHVYVLGDFAYRNKNSITNYVKRLNGVIHLIRGNHDKRTDAFERCFEEVADYKEIVVEVNGEKTRVVLSHYFIPFYNGARRRSKAIMLHGHTHKEQESEIEEKMKKMLRESGFLCEAYNVGCMWQNYEPQTLEEIIARQERNPEESFQDS